MTFDDSLLFNFNKALGWYTLLLISSNMAHHQMPGMTELSDLFPNVSEGKDGHHFGSQTHAF